MYAKSRGFMLANALKQFWVWCDPMFILDL
jgi:hypothetical protein